MALEPEHARILIGSSSTYAAMPPNGSHPLLDSLWRSTAVTLMNHGSWISRVGKLERIADNEVVRDTLRVCWQNPDLGLNCGRCEKCLRTMTVLEVLGLLDRFVTLPDELELETSGPHDARSPVVRRRMASGARAGRAARSQGAS